MVEESRNIRPPPPTEATKYMFSKAFLTWPLAGSSLQLLHWLLLVQEALKEWESSIELKGNFFLKRISQISLMRKSLFRRNEVLTVQVCGSNIKESDWSSYFL